MSYFNILNKISLILLIISFNLIYFSALSCKLGTGTTKTGTLECPLYDAIVPEKSTCGDPAHLICTKGCTGSVVAEKCTFLATGQMVAGSVNCSGAFMKGDSRGYACQNEKGTYYCNGDFSGVATCSGCRNITADDNKPGDPYCVPRPCTPRR